MIINDQIGHNEWVLGQRFSAADIYLFMLTKWLCPAQEHPAISEFPNAKRIADKVLERSSVRRVYQPWVENPEN